MKANPNSHHLKKKKKSLQKAEIFSLKVEPQKEETKKKRQKKKKKKKHSLSDSLHLDSKKKHYF